MTKRQVISVVVLAVMIAMAPGTLWAKKIQTEAYQVGCTTLAGTEFLTDDGRVLHIVGEFEKGIHYDATTFEVLGEYSAVVNIEIKLPSEKVRLCGTFSILYPSYSPGTTLDGTFNGKIGAQGFAARARGQGTFSHRRDISKSQFRSVAPDAIPTEIQQILSESPWTECERIIGPYLVTGFIRLTDER